MRYHSEHYSSRYRRRNPFREGLPGTVAQAQRNDELRARLAEGQQRARAQMGGSVLSCVHELFQRPRRREL
ncbi:hypothetical protein [Mycobacterium sp. SMC-15]|uniref:hypothetical protein n=1 Tax=Mycobacterium sp. SMC-15 TaxID=3381627 RepID=UPI003875B145